MIATLLSMKTFALALALFASDVPAQTPAQSKCTSLHFENTKLCTFPDGSGAETTYSNGTWTDTDYAPEAWTARYTKLMKLDADFLQSSTAIRAKYTAALAIQDKKSCNAAGFYWVHRVCSVEPIK